MPIKAVGKYFLGC